MNNPHSFVKFILDEKADKLVMQPSLSRLPGGSGSVIRFTYVLARKTARDRFIVDRPSLLADGADQLDDDIDRTEYTEYPEAHIEGHADMISKHSDSFFQVILPVGLGLFAIFLGIRIIPGLVSQNHIQNL